MAQAFVAGEMPVMVVVAFEMVDVDQQQTQRFLVAPGTRHFQCQAFIKPTTVGNARQTVNVG